MTKFFFSSHNCLLLFCRPDDTPWDGGNSWIALGYQYLSLIQHVLIIFLLIGTFKLTLLFAEDYPNKPPIVHFVSKMFHPNSEYSLHRWMLKFVLLELSKWLFESFVVKGCYNSRLIKIDYKSHISHTHI